MKKLLEALDAIYKNLEQEIGSLEKPPICKACGECCDFSKFEHTPFITKSELKNIEVALTQNKELLEEAAKPKPINFCAFYRDKRCIAHKIRPLSCRVFFCDSKYAAEHASRIYEKYHKLIKDLHLRFEVEYSYQPLVSALDRLIAELLR